MNVTRLISGQRILLLLGVLLYCHSAQAQPSDSLAIVTGDDYFPFVKQSLPESGWSPALVKAAFNAVDIPVSIEHLPWPDAYDATQANQFDAIFPYVHTQRRSEQFLYSNPLNVTQLRYYVSSQSEIQHTQDSIGRCFCLPEGYELATNIAKTQIPYGYDYHRADSALACALLVEQQQCDLGFIDAHQSLRLFSDQQGRSLDLRVLPDIIGRTTLHLLVPKSHPRAGWVLERFNTGLRKINQSGQRSVINQRFEEIKDEE
ncbi:hypothetical protein HMF8227_00476 [Saliniradius amylolyticus]|uniref:Solute-binding protein family 3/N-terminal domain-containing protein n=1 Tax=Saliniradius amylolyticus TaxID=2183582 RepID=A0A2S2E0A7_9ALTE|nr:transporter substrate-binding domain-containing protein [Saliniradius amylolyticus]AWL10972.1 hypothetical protein HMF8227_00476 [Saliniradius amylolyticus]